MMEYKENYNTVILEGVISLIFNNLLKILLAVWVEN